MQDLVIIRNIRENLDYYFKVSQQYHIFESNYYNSLENGYIYPFQIEEYESILDNYKDLYKCVRFDLIADIKCIHNKDLRTFLLESLELCELNIFFVDQLKDILLYLVESGKYNTFYLDNYPDYDKSHYKKCRCCVKLVFYHIIEEKEEYYKNSSNSSKSTYKFLSHTSLSGGKGALPFLSFRNL